MLLALPIAREQCISTLEVFYESVSHKLLGFRPAFPITNTLNKL